MPLTDRAIKLAKPQAKTSKLSDGQGLQLWITPAGSKLWRLAYRFGGHQKQLALGRYPAVSLAEAREKRDDQRKILAKGIDPSVLRKRVAGDTFDAIADEWLQRQSDEGRAHRTIEKNRWLLSLARPAIGPRPISEVTAAEVLSVLRQAESRTHLETARRLRSVVGAVFRFAIATTRAESDPTLALRGAIRAPKVKHRAAITDALEFGALMRAIEGFEGQPTTRAALQLCALLAPRPGELRFAHWTEFDLQNAIWTVPQERMKMRRAHQVPLPRQAVAILERLHSITGRNELAFPCVRDRGRPLSENTLNAALRRLGYDQDQATAHGFRASFSTLANESGQWSPDAIERHLAHLDGNEVRRAYNRGAYWDERVKLAQWWAHEIDRLRRSGEVVSMRAVG